MKSIIIGYGILNWHRYERQTDRYGSIHLHLGLAMSDGDPDPGDYVVFPSGLEGRRGRLFAVVREARESSHVGDSARNIEPSGSLVGERVDLGEGTVFLGSCVDGRFPEREEIPVCTIGLLPDDGREHDWLNPQSLYKLHEQTVELHFEPSPPLNGVPTADLPFGVG